MKIKYVIAYLLAFVIAVSPIVSFVGLAEASDFTAGLSSDANDVERHVEYISSQLTRYDESTSYFEKYGISVKLRDYFTKNSVDISVPEIAELYAANEEHISVLLSMVDEYELLLKENAELFIEKCDELEDVEDYLTLKRLCDEARFCFFNMDVSVDGVQDAIILYESKLDFIVEMENNANAFIAEVNALCRATDDDNKLALVIRANCALSQADLGVPGVSEAIEEFKIAMAEYDSSIAAANSEIALTRRYAARLRNYEGQEEFIGYILDIIG
jgi:hypothetical protein